MNQTLTYVLIVLALVIGMGFRVYRMTRERRWSVSRMWISPAIFLVITIGVVVLDARTSTPLAALLAPLGLVAGIAIGFYQGTHTTVRVDKPNHSLFVKTSPIGALIFIGVLALRIGLRFASGGMAAVQAAQTQPGVVALPPAAAIFGSVLLALAAGSVLGLRIYLQGIYNKADQGRPLQ